MSAAEINISSRWATANMLFVIFSAAIVPLYAKILFLHFYSILFLLNPTNNVSQGFLHHIQYSSKIPVFHDMATLDCFTWGRYKSSKGHLKSWSSREALKWWV